MTEKGEQWPQGPEEDSQSHSCFASCTCLEAWFASICSAYLRLSALSRIYDWQTTLLASFPPTLPLTTLLPPLPFYSLVVLSGLES